VTALIAAVCAALGGWLCWAGLRRRSQTKRVPVPTGEVNALGRLRERFEVPRAELAKRLAIPLAGVALIERTPLRLLEVDTVQKFVEALECRLDIVAQHLDGEAIWLSDERGTS
jgi:hypothetical protein